MVAHVCYLWKRYANRRSQIEAQNRRVSGFFCLKTWLTVSIREIILPSKSYKRVLDALEQRNYLDILSDMEQKMRFEGNAISSHIISLAVARNRLLKDIGQLAEREVAALSGVGSTPFLLLVFDSILIYPS